MSARRREIVVAALACVYAAIVIPIAVHKGGDFTSELSQSERLLHGQTPFGAADPNLGVPWPPFSAVLLIPFALIARFSLPLAKALWAGGSVICLWWVMRWAMRRHGPPALLAFAAVAVPIQTNFEHANIAVVLLALVILAIAELEQGRETRAAVAIGVAAALKAFPALLLVYLATQRRWRGLAIGTGVAAALTLLALLPLGVTRLVPNVRDWLLLGLEHHWVTQPASNQSLPALVARLGGSATVSLTLNLLLVMTAFLVLVRYRPDPLAGLGVLILLGVVLPPIAWVHAFVLLFPAWLAAVTSKPRAPASRVALLVAAIGTSGLFTVGPRALRSGMLEHSVYAWSALLLLLLVVLALRQRPVTANV